MQFIIWSSLVLFIFSAIAWFGGLLFVTSVLMPIAKYENDFSQTLFYQSIRRFHGIVLMCIWTMIITGFILVAVEQKYIWLKLSSTWDYLFFSIEIVFLLGCFFTFLIGKNFKLIDKNKTQNPDELQKNESFEKNIFSVLKFMKINILLGIISILVFTAMVYYG